MIRRRPRYTRTDTLFPYAALCRSGDVHVGLEDGIADQRLAQRRPPLRIHRHAGGAARRGAGKVVAAFPGFDERNAAEERSEEHTSELQSLMRISYAVFCLKKKNNQDSQQTTDHITQLLSSRF